MSEKLEYVFKKKHFLKHQWNFINCNEAIKALVAGYGSGKTYAFLFETLKNHINQRHEPKNIKSYGWVIYPTFELAEEIFIPQFCQILQNLEIEFKYLSSKKTLSTKYGDIRILSLQNPNRMVGKELGYAGFDEFDVESTKLCTQAYQKVIGRLRACNNPKLYIVTTPEGFKTTYRLFVEEKKGKLFKAKTTDNPYLPPNYIEQLKKQYSTKLLNQYLNGEFINLNGSAAYYDFDRKSHVSNTLEPIKEVWIGMDFNVNPMTAVCAVFEKNKLFVFKEIYLKNSSTARMAEQIKTYFGKFEIIICPDMTGIKRSTAASGGITDIDILQKAGFRISGSRNPFVRDRLNTVNACFNQNKIVINPNCKKLIRDLEQVVLDDYGELDKSNSELTHISDAFGYLVWRVFKQNNVSWRTA